MTDDYLNKLNNEQRQAVIQTEGPMLILAGAGSGKTATLTSKIAYLLKNNLANQQEILAVTFTNKAAQEMRNRIASILELSAINRFFMPFMGTFHGICLKLLKSYSQSINLASNFIIYDESDRQATIKKIYKELNINDKLYPIKTISYLLSQDKNDLSGLFLTLEDSPLNRLALRVKELYINSLKQANALDFDDLILKTIELLENVTEVRSKLRQQFKYLLIDEYQDTNEMQYKLVKLLVNDRQNITVIGDDWQTIFSWRGADYHNILNFENDFDNVKVVKLEQNYRSTQAILEASNKIILKNSQQSTKKLWTNKTSSQPIIHLQAINENDEADKVAKKIYEYYQAKRYGYNDFAILYRTNAQSRAIEEAFLRYGLPYKVIGGLKFYDRKEIKDIMAYLKFIYNGTDLISFSRIVNIPSRAIGPKSLEKFNLISQQQQLTIFQTLEFIAKSSQANGLIPKAIQGFKELYYLIHAIQTFSLEHNIYEVIERLINEADYLEYLNDGSLQAENRQENVKELLSVAREYIDCDLGQFLEEVSLVSDVDALDPQAETVTLMTVHSAKGLEFPVVFMVGMEESIFPHANSSLDVSQLEEERRLCYVGITRAKDELFMSSASSRLLFGGVLYNPPSRFLKEIDLAVDNYYYQSPSLTTDNDLTLNLTKNSEPRYVPDVEVGDAIKHQHFGIGTILELEGDLALIQFQNKTLKKLDISFAPIQKIA